MLLKHEGQASNDQVNASPKVNHLSDSIIILGKQLPLNILKTIEKVKVICTSSISRCNTEL